MLQLNSSSCLGLKSAKMHFWSEFLQRFFHRSWLSYLSLLHTREVSATVKRGGRGRYLLYSQRVLVLRYSMPLKTLKIHTQWSKNDTIVNFIFIPSNMYTGFRINVNQNPQNHSNSNNSTEFSRGFT